MTEYRTETVETPAGTYTVELHYDEDSENPLTAWDHEGMAFYTHGDGLITNDTMDDADRAGDVLRQLIGRSYYDSQEDITRRYRKWAAITGSPWVLVIGSDSASQSDFYRWYVLVDSSATYVASDGKSYASLPHPVDTARATMADYRKWAAGEVCGFVTKSPDGNEVESVWGFYDDHEALAEGESIAQWNAEHRVDQANHVGAGFVGIV